jgi:predicted ATP-binding protein involved in virulence
MSDKKDAVYFKSLTTENVKCFRDKQTIDFTNKNGKPAKWTVILGNNNTGKTTLLRALADFNIKIEYLEDKYKKDKDKHIEVRFFGSELKQFNSWTKQQKDFQKTIEISADIIHKGEIVSYPIKFEEGTTSSGKPFGNTDFMYHLKIFAYGTNRRPSTNITSLDDSNDIESLYDDTLMLINTEEWLKGIYLAAKNGATKAESRLKKIKQVLRDVLPDVNDFRFVTNEETFVTNVEVQTDYGWMKINDLGYGYQSLSTWVIDLAKKMFDHYPNSENPLHEPAIVLVDEIDLHLHPEWQRKIISYLSANFPNTQFIVTSHSPLVVQSADEVNVVLLKKVGDKVVIEQPEIENFQGWSVEEILREVMDLDERTHSEKYIELRQKFEEALDESDYEKAKLAKSALAEILNPHSTQAKIMEIQMTSLTAQFMEN